MDETQKTIAFLRTLTLDGVLTSDEVWALGKFFNDNPGCTRVWPGDVLAPMISSAFDDESINEEEMTLLAETISSVESEWLTQNPGLAESEEYAGPFSTRPAIIPSVEARYDIPSQREDSSFVVSLSEPACTCPEWQNRRAFPEHTPGRCCKHVCYAYVRTGKVFEPWFQAIIDDCFAYARGAQSSRDWLLVELPEQKPAVLTVGPNKWCNVLAPTGEGYETFAYNPEQQRWSYGEAPAHRGAIEKAIRTEFLQQAAAV
ncbi:MAG TPA: hypothetical protein VF773_21710 [Verrucomicrobiae bacterium]